MKRHETVTTDLVPSGLKKSCGCVDINFPIIRYSSAVVSVLFFNLCLWSFRLNDDKLLSFVFKGEISSIVLFFAMAILIQSGASSLKSSDHVVKGRPLLRCPSLGYNSSTTWTNPVWTHARIHTSLATSLITVLRLTPTFRRRSLRKISSIKLGSPVCQSETRYAKNTLEQAVHNRSLLPFCCLLENHYKICNQKICVILIIN